MENRLYTVIVAEDEEEIRRGIIRKTDWEKSGFRVIGEAENGADALELVEKMEPDLLLTDIKMPFLSGIELARQIREVRPTVQIAFLSGFDDFTYAQQAIQYNIVSYMLKPITAAELEAELYKIKEKLDEKFSIFAKNSEVQKEMEKSEFIMPLLLDSSLQDRADEKEMQENAIACGFLRQPSPENFRYVVLITEIVDYDGIDKTSRASVDAIEMILNKYVRNINCYLKGRVVSVLAATPAGFTKYLHIIVEEIVQSVERLMNYTCRVGVSRMEKNLVNCREGYLEAMNAISYARSGESNVYFISDEEKSESFSQEELQNGVDKAEMLLRGGKKEELEAYLDKLEESVRLGENSSVMFALLTTQIAATVNKVIYAVAGNEGVSKMQSEYPVKDIQDVERMSEKFQNVKKMCLYAKEMISEQRKKSSEVICETVLFMIDSKYTDPELSVMSVSDEIGITPNYLSAIIKKITGKNFVELLTEKRIAKAKELLCSTPMKIREITEACGYRDQYYFSHCFKKIVGMSPNACRKEFGCNG